MVYPGICGIVRIGFGLWVSAGRVAFRGGGGDLDRGRAAALEPQAAAHCIARLCRGVLILLTGPWQRRPRRFPLQQ